MSRGIKGTDRRYHAVGPIRGRCGHKHVTIRAAVRCCARDQKGCASQGGYSDRFVQRIDGEPLSEAEHEDALNAADAFRQGYWKL